MVRRWWHGGESSSATAAASAFPNGNHQRHQPYREHQHKSISYPVMARHPVHPGDTEGEWLEVKKAKPQACILGAFGLDGRGRRSLALAGLIGAAAWDPARQDTRDGFVCVQGNAGGRFPRVPAQRREGHAGSGGLTCGEPPRSPARRLGAGTTCVLTRRLPAWQSTAAPRPWSDTGNRP